MPTAHALRLCPGLVLVPPDRALYRRLHNRMRAVTDRFFPATDWTRVDLERLRQHLIDMSAVMLGAVVKQAPVPGGLAMEITGAGRTEHAIRAMVVPHAVELDRMPEWSAKTESLPGGVRLTVIAEKPDDARLIARIRGLGFAGLITEGAHHQPHHLAMARGEAFTGHTR